MLRTLLSTSRPAHIQTIFLNFRSLIYCWSSLFGSFAEQSVKHQFFSGSSEGLPRGDADYEVGPELKRSLTLFEASAELDFLLNPTSPTTSRTFGEPWRHVPQFRQFRRTSVGFVQISSLSDARFKLRTVAEKLLWKQLRRPVSVWWQDGQCLSRSKQLTVMHSANLYQCGPLILSPSSFWNAKVIIRLVSTSIHTPLPALWTVLS